VTMEIEIKCQKCDSDLAHVLKERQRSYRTDWVIEVEPCEKCLVEARDAGFDEGSRGE